MSDNEVDNVDVQTDPMKNILNAIVSKDMINLQKSVNDQMMARSAEQIDMMKKDVASTMMGVEPDQSEDDYQQYDIDEDDVDDIEIDDQEIEDILDDESEEESEEEESDESV